MTSLVKTERATQVARLFPQGIPDLWCPSLTHYTANGDLDAQRISSHLKYLSQFVPGYLIPGSTGDGWELSDAEIISLLEIVIPLASRLGFQILIGALKTDGPQMHQAIVRLME